MNEHSFMRVDDVAQELGVSRSYAYKLIQRLNADLREKGYLTISGRVSRRYFEEKLCYGQTERPANKSQVEISDFLGRQKGNTKSSR